MEKIMTMRKEELRNAYQKPISRDSEIHEHAGSFVVYSIGMSILSGIVTAALVTFFGVFGAILGILFQLFVLYRITSKLFQSVDELIVSRINRREKELLESLEADNHADGEE